MQGVLGTEQCWCTPLVWLHSMKERFLTRQRSLVCNIHTHICCPFLHVFPTWFASVAKCSIPVADECLEYDFSELN